ncbi:MAG TPA: acyltransferase [Actinocatenispora sp.]
MTGWARRIAAATPAYRDRTVDALRALAIVGVVLGHWLVSGTVSDPDQPARLFGASPLSHLPAMAPVTWLLQTLAPFFFAGGYAAARSLRHRGPNTVSWLTSRGVRLLRPVVVLAAIWGPGLLLLTAVGAPGDTRHLVWSLVSHPMWFLLVYLVLTALTPALLAAWRRVGWWSLLPPILLIAGLDAVRGNGIPTWLGLLAVPVGWAVPYLAGIAFAEGRLVRWHGAVLLALGVGGGAGLIALGYPASAVGVPGDHWSNLDPPSLVALALGATQVGLFLLVRPWLARLLRRPLAWAPVAALNLVAMTVFCWHQTALLVVSFGGLVAGRVPGLLDEPGAAWVGHRLAWLPVFAVVLVLLVALFHRFEHPRTTRPVPAPVTPPVPAVAVGHSGQAAATDDERV